MPSYRRSAASLDELREQVLLAFGPEARIVEATRVTRRGVGRWLARDEIEATVEVPEGAAPAGGVDASRLDRSGIAALLADADDGDGGLGELGHLAGGAPAELHLGDLTARPAAGAPALEPRARHNATPRAPEAPSDVAFRRTHDADGVGEAEPPLPSTSAPAFAALLDAVERSLGIEEPPGGAREPLLALPEPAEPRARHNATSEPSAAPSDVAIRRIHEDGEPEEPPADADAPTPPVRQFGRSAPRETAASGADVEKWRDDSEVGGASAAAARSTANGGPSLPSGVATALLRQNEPPSSPAAVVRGAVGGRWRDHARAEAPEAGDLVLLVGLGDDAVRVAREISAERGWPVSWVRVTAARSKARAGTPSVSRTSVIADRRAALSARADALRLEREVLLAHAATIDDPFTAVTALRPDRVWAVVDASRTPSETAEWIGRLDEALGVDAVAVVGTAFTRDRDTAARLGLPVAWQEPPEASA